MVADGRFDKDMPVNEHFEERMSPTNKAKGYNTSRIRSTICRLDNDGVASGDCSFKPGNALG